MKTCFKCKQTKPLDGFYRHPQMADGHLNKCIDCTKKDVNAHRARNVDRIRSEDRARSKTPKYRAKAIVQARLMRAKSPEKYAARTAVGNALRDGRLTRQPCACGNPKSQAHHDDYSKPLDVRWLCVKCHWAHHNAERKAA